jgi:hypothetical protein
MTHILISCIAMQPDSTGCGKLMLVIGWPLPNRKLRKIPPFTGSRNFLGTARIRFPNQGLSFLIPFPGGSGGRRLSLILQSSGLSCAKKSPANAPTLAIISYPGRGSIPCRVTKRTRPCDPPFIERQSCYPH